MVGPVRANFYTKGSRGQVGRLALAVAAIADEDRDAANILTRRASNLHASPSS